MQKLHLVGFTTDHKSLILSARRGARSGGFVLEITDELLAALEAAAVQVEPAPEPEPEVAPARPESTMSVRELQARLRAGRSIEAVAAEAGVDTDWVDRFAAPVLAEQAQVIDDLRASVYARPRLGPSALPLGPSVYRNLAAKGVTAVDADLDRAWSARQVVDSRWLVTFTYRSRGKRQQAVWELDAATGEVVAHDRLAGQLAFVPGGASPAPPAARGQAAAAPDVNRIHSRRVAEARKAAEVALDQAARRSSKRSAAAARRAGSTRTKAATPRPGDADPAPPSEVDHELVQRADDPPGAPVVESRDDGPPASPESIPLVEVGVRPERAPRRSVVAPLDDAPASGDDAEPAPVPESPFAAEAGPATTADAVVVAGADTDIEADADADDTADDTADADALPRRSVADEPAVRAVASVREAAEALLLSLTSGRTPLEAIDAAVDSDTDTDTDAAGDLGDLGDRADDDDDTEGGWGDLAAVEAELRPAARHERRPASSSADDGAPAAPVGAGAPTGRLRFRDDLTTAAAGNGDRPGPAPAPAPTAGPPEAPGTEGRPRRPVPPAGRPRRTTPLRARRGVS